jgi:hypothetical protein
VEPLTLARSDSGAFLSRRRRDGWPTAIVGLMCLIKACQHGKAHQIKLEKTYSSRQTLYSILRTRSYLYTRCTRGTSTTTWSWPGGENSEEGGAGLRHCRPAAVAAAAASLPLCRHPRRHSRRRLHLHPPRFSAFPSAMPSASAIHRCRPSLPPTPRPSPPPASTARIGHRHRRHLRRHHCQRERRLGRGRGRGLG